MKFVKEDFAEDELNLLCMAFKLLDTAVDGMYKLDYTNYANDVYRLKQKLGIDEFVEV